MATAITEPISSPGLAVARQGQGGAALSLLRVIARPSGRNAAQDQVLLRARWHRARRAAALGRSRRPYGAAWGPVPNAVPCLPCASIAARRDQPEGA